MMSASVLWPFASFRGRAATRSLLEEADINWQAKPANRVENGPYETSVMAGTSPAITTLETACLNPTTSSSGLASADRVGSSPCGRP
jgi:hypothetical protein